MAQKNEKPKSRPIIWMGDSKDKLSSFPQEVKRDMGFALRAVQEGLIPDNTEPLKGIGSGVFEIKERYDKEAYRTTFALKLGEEVYVLHAYHKKSKSGIGIPKRDLELIKQRYKEAKEEAKDD